MIKIYAVSKIRHLQSVGEGRWFELPKSIDKISADLQLKNEQDLLILDYDAPFKLDIEAPLAKLNDIAQRLDGLPQHLVDDMDDLVGDIYDSVEEVLAKPNKYKFVSDILTDQQLGFYLIKEDRWHTIPSDVKPFVDERLYGQDYRHLTGATYTQSGVYLT